MLVTMKLVKKQFDAVKEGRKTIEMRLYDEKRRAIKKGDTIEFINRDNPEERVQTTVLSYAVYNNFAELYTNYTKRELGYLDSEVANPKDMEQYFSPEKQQGKKVIAIRVELI